jgi:hypothetical protein
MRMLRSSIQSTPSVRDDEVPRLRAHGLAYRPVEPNYDGHCRRKGYARSFNTFGIEGGWAVYLGNTEPSLPGKSSGPTNRR